MVLRHGELRTTAAFVTLNTLLCLSVSPVYDFVCDLPFWERRDLSRNAIDMKLRVAWRNIVHYVRTDLKEIAFPSSLPDPPSSKPKPRKLTVREHLQVWRTGTYLYIRSWRTGTFDDDEEEKEDVSVKTKEKESEEPSILEELALASRAGSEKLRPALQKLYMTRASTYRDALQSFVQGYQEGIGEVMRATKASNSPVDWEAYSGGEGSHQSNVTPSGGETKKEQHDGGMKI